MNAPITNIDLTMAISRNKTPSQQLIEQHHKLVHTDNIKVVSHVQRELDDWYLNTLMLDNIDVPFKYKRKKLYKNLKSARVNITYYADHENVAGFDIEVMKIVRIKSS